MTIWIGVGLIDAAGFNGFNVLFLISMMMSRPGISILSPVFYKDNVVHSIHKFGLSRCRSSSNLKGEWWSSNHCCSRGFPFLQVSYFTHKFDVQWRTCSPTQL